MHHVGGGRKREGATALTMCTGLVSACRRRGCVPRPLPGQDSQPLILQRWPVCWVCSAAVVRPLGGLPWTWRALHVPPSSSIVGVTTEDAANPPWPGACLPPLPPNRRPLVARPGPVHHTRVRRSAAAAASVGGLLCSSARAASALRRRDRPKMRGGIHRVPMGRYISCDRERDQSDRPGVAAAPPRVAVLKRPVAKVLSFGRYIYD